MTGGRDRSSWITGNRSSIGQSARGKGTEFSTGDGTWRENAFDLHGVQDDNESSLKKAQRIISQIQLNGIPSPRRNQKTKEARLLEDLYGYTPHVQLRVGEDIDVTDNFLPLTEDEEWMCRVVEAMIDRREKEYETKQSNPKQAEKVFREMFTPTMASSESSEEYSSDEMDESSLSDWEEDWAESPGENDRSSPTDQQISLTTPFSSCEIVKNVQFDETLRRKDTSHDDLEKIVSGQVEKGEGLETEDFQNPTFSEQSKYEHDDDCELETSETSSAMTYEKEHRIVPDNIKQAGVTPPNDVRNVCGSRSFEEILNNIEEEKARFQKNENAGHSSNTELQTTTPTTATETKTTTSTPCSLCDNIEHLRFDDTSRQDNFNFDGHERMVSGQVEKEEGWETSSLQVATTCENFDVEFDDFTEETSENDSSSTPQTPNEHDKKQCAMVDSIETSGPIRSSVRNDDGSLDSTEVGLTSVEEEKAWAQKNENAGRFRRNFFKSQIDDSPAARTQRARASIDYARLQKERMNLRKHFDHRGLHAASSTSSIRRTSTQQSGFTTSLTALSEEFRIQQLTGAARQTFDSYLRQEIAHHKLASGKSSHHK